MSFASQVFVRIEIKHFLPIELLRLPAYHRIMAHYLPRTHKVLLQMHILVQFPFVSKYDYHISGGIIEPTAVEQHTSDRRPHFGLFLSEDIHSMMRRTIHAMGPRMPPERMMVIAVRSPARHLIPLRNNQTYHKQRCGSDKDMLDTLFPLVKYLGMRYVCFIGFNSYFCSYNYHLCEGNRPNNNTTINMMIVK